MAVHSGVRLIVDRFPIRVNRKQHRSCGGGSVAATAGLVRVCVLVHSGGRFEASSSDDRARHERDRRRTVFVCPRWVVGWLRGFIENVNQQQHTMRLTASDSVRVSLSLSLSKRERKEIIIKADQRRGMDKEWDGMG